MWGVFEDEGETLHDRQLLYIFTSKNILLDKYEGATLVEVTPHIGTQPKL